MKPLVTLINLAFMGTTIWAFVASVRGDRGPLVVWITMAFLAMNVLAAAIRGVRARARSNAHAREERGAEVAPLAPGDTVLHGKVAYALGADEAMRVEFVQSGSESESSGTWSHSWKEISRKLTVQPFYLVRRDGTRVRVEPPPDDSRLFDELESRILVRSELGTPTAPSAPVRGRFATLVPDETIWVTGRLRRGSDPEGSVEAAGTYRNVSGPSGWVMGGSPTLLVSSVSLARHFAERARRHFRDAVIYAVLLVAPAIFAERYLDRSNGRPVAATVTVVERMTNDDGDTTGYQAVVEFDGRLERTDSLPFAPPAGSTLTMRWGTHTANEGADPRLTTDEIILAFVTLVACLVARGVLSWASGNALPWYRSDDATVNESGSGRLVVPS